MNKMPLDVRLDVEKNIANIENGTFNEQEIKNLLVDLREYSDQKTFIDFANFVTHHHRDTGFIFDKIYESYIKTRGMLEFKSKPDQPYKIDPNKVFEKWEYDYLLVQFDTMSESDVHKFFKTKKKKAKQKLMSCFTKAKNGLRNIQKGKLDEAQQIFNILLGRWKLPKAFITGDDVFDSFIKTLIENNVNFDQQKFMHYKNEIIIAILINVNHRKFQFSRTNKKIFGEIFLTFDNLVIPYPKIFMLSAGLKVHKSGKGGLVVPVLITNIKNRDLISDGLFTRVRIKNVYVNEFAFKVSSALTLKNVNGKLKLCEKV